MPTRPGALPRGSARRAASSLCSHEAAVPKRPFPGRRCGRGEPLVHCRQQRVSCSSKHRTSSKEPRRGCTTEETGKAGEDFPALGRANVQHRNVCLVLALPDDVVDSSPYCA